MDGSEKIVGYRQPDGWLHSYLFQPTADTSKVAIVNKGFTSFSKCLHRQTHILIYLDTFKVQKSISTSLQFCYEARSVEILQAESDLSGAPPKSLHLR